MPISGRLLLLLFLIPLLASSTTSVTTPLASAAELSVAWHPSKVVMPPGRPVEDSPGARPGAAVACNRVHIHGLSRFKNLSKFAHALKLKVSVAGGDAVFRSHNIELCLHRNASIGMGMCPPGQWQKLPKGGSWVQSTSPYGNLILDIRMPLEPSRSIEVSTEEEFLFHRMVFLILGAVMMMLAHFLSESVVFYYGSAMTIGIVLVILMILFQGMRLLPTGRKSSLAIFLYSSIVGVATFLLNYISGLLRSVLVEIGISEDMHNPLGIMLLVCLVLAGAWFGYWGVRKLVLTDDGLVDSGVAYFVEWAILIFSAVMILQCSLDTLLAVEALVIVSAMTWIQRKFGFLNNLRRQMVRNLDRIQDQFSPSSFSHVEYLYSSQKSESKLPGYRIKHLTPTSCTSGRGGLSGSAKTPPPIPYEEGTYYSTFHKTPERKKFSKEEWETFTGDHTRKALRDLVSSPHFTQWAVANAERITLTPPENHSRGKKHHRFYWF